MPTINIKYYKRWNSSLNSDAGGWEYFAFKTPIAAVVEDSSYKRLTTSEKNFIDGLLNNNIIDDYNNTVENTYYKGQLVVNNYKVYICTEDVTIAADESITTSGKFTPFTVTETEIDNKISTLADTITSALSGKVNTSDIIENNKFKYSYFPDTITGQLVYGGTVTGAGVASLTSNAQAKLGTSSETITLTNSANADTGYSSSTVTSKQEGIFYVVSSNGNFASLDLQVGDWLLVTRTAWKKIDNTDAVTMVNGHIGNVYVYQGAFLDGTEQNDRIELSSFTARNKGDIWYGSATGRIYINTKDITQALISGSGKTYLYEFINYCAGIGSGAATTEEEGLGAIRPIGAPDATDSRKGVVKLYTTLSGHSNATDGTLDVNAISGIKSSLETNINNHKVHLSEPSTKYDGIIWLADS